MINDLAQYRRTTKHLVCTFVGALVSLGNKSRIAGYVCAIIADNKQRNQASKQRQLPRPTDSGAGDSHTDCNWRPVVYALLCSLTAVTTCSDL